MKLIPLFLVCNLAFMVHAMESTGAGAGNAKSVQPNSLGLTESDEIAMWLKTADIVEPITYRESTYLEGLFKSGTLTYASVAPYLSSINPEKNSLRLKPFLKKHQSDLEESANTVFALGHPLFVKIEHAFTCLFILSKIMPDGAAFTDKKIALVQEHEAFLQERRTQGLQSSSVLNEISEALTSCKMLQSIKRGMESQLLDDDEEILSAKMNPRHSKFPSRKNSQSELPRDYNKKRSFLNSPRFVVPAFIIITAAVGYFFLKIYREKTGKPSLLDFALSRQNNL